MRRTMLTNGFVVLICAAPIAQPHAEAQSGTRELGVRLAVLHSLNVVFDANLNATTSDAPVTAMRTASDAFQLMRLVKSENLDALLERYSADAAVVLPDGQSVDVDGLRGWYQQAFDRFTVSRTTMRLNRSAWQVIGDYAMATGFVVADLSDRTAQVSDLTVSSEFKVLLVKRQGTWRVLRHSFLEPNASWRTAN